MITSAISIAAELQEEQRLGRRKREVAEYTSAKIAKLGGLGFPADHLLARLSPLVTMLCL